jgi:hypothetical protein
MGSTIQVIEMIIINSRWCANSDISTHPQQPSSILSKVQDYNVERRVWLVKLILQCLP